MDKWSLLTGSASLLSLVISLYELRRKNAGASAFFLCIFLVFAFLVFRNEDNPEVLRRFTNATSPVNSTRQVVESQVTPQQVPDLRELMMASDAYKVDSDIVKVVIQAHHGSASPPDVAHQLRQLLERYNFDLVKALGAYDVGTDRVDECNCVPPDARQYVADIVKEFNNRKKIDLEVVPASAAYSLDPDLLNIVIHANIGPTSPPTAAQHLRELLERYNFDLIKTLGAYRVGAERVDACNCVPADARQYVADIVREFNKKVIARRAADSSGPQAGPE